MRSSFCHDHNAVQWELSETPQALPRPRRELERASRRNTSIPAFTLRTALSSGKYTPYDIAPVEIRVQ